MAEEQKAKKAARERERRARLKEAAKSDMQAPIDPAPESATNLDAEAQEEAYNAFFKNVADLTPFELMQRRRSKYS